MHTVYQTRGFVLSGLPAGEASRILRIFTRELGLIIASARGVRSLRSKLRYALQDFSYASISLLRGRNLWRVTTASPQRDFEFSRRTSAARLLPVRLLTLLARLLPEEEPHEQLFDSITAAFSFLTREEITRDDLRRLEYLLVREILTETGYLPPLSSMDVSPVGWSRQKLGSIAGREREVVREINHSLRASGL